MKIEYTSRGFKIGTFTDCNGEECTMQESSRASEEGLIWLGAKEVNVQVMTQSGWKHVDFNTMSIDGQFVGNQRMHLSQSKVKAMLPILTYFAEHGCLPDSEEDLLSPAESGY